MLPAILLSRLQDILGKDYQHVMDAFSGNRIGSLRINTLKAHDEEVIQEYAQKSIPLIPFPSLQHVYTFDRQYEYTLK